MHSSNWIGALLFSPMRPSHRNWNRVESQSSDDRNVIQCMFLADGLFLVRNNDENITILIDLNNVSSRHSNPALV